MPNATTPDADGRRAYPGKLIFPRMASNCGGMVRFGNHPDGIGLDRPLPRGHTLRSGARAMAISGLSPTWADPPAIDARVAATSPGRGEVSIGDAAEAGIAGASPVRGSLPWPSLPAPVRLTSPGA